MNFDPAELAARLALVADGEVKTHMPLAPYTSYRIGGPSAVWVAPETESGVGRVLEIIHALPVPLFILGRGSNVLISDQGWQGVTLYLGRNFTGWRFAGRTAKVQAGTRLEDLIRTAVAKGLAGLEQLAGIPGGIGGALRMNAGAFGREIEKVTVAVRGFRRDGSPVAVSPQEIGFGYRCAPGLEDVVITSADFGFDPAEASALRVRMNAILNLRAQKQPIDYPSCGSVFKRPSGYFAGALIEEAGLKGATIGGAMVSPQHAGFILNVDNASAADVYALMRRIEHKVWERFGVELEREVKLIGAFDEDP
ncbi:MAG: UDP-N-acetylmuramate dehydrogenase [Desulfobacterales bacterium]|nr:MAG: UDP-N-acetylmuramate dehydrogenase [Desulfobacterales bacterium]